MKLHIFCFHNVTLQTKQHHGKHLLQHTQVVEAESGFFSGWGGTCNLSCFNRTGKECVERSVIIL